MRNSAPVLWRTAKNVATVHKLRAEGLTYTQIGRRLGVSPAVVRVANTKGEATCNQHNAETVRAVLMMLESGVPQIEVARQFGVSAFSIRSWRICARLSLAETAGAGATQSLLSSPAPAAPLPRIRVCLPEHVARMRDSLAARGMARETALREAMRICAGSAVDARGGARAAGAGDGFVFFHGQNMQESWR